jgi:hypothetical protein
MILILAYSYNNYEGIDILHSEIDDNISKEDLEIEKEHLYKELVEQYRQEDDDGSMSDEEILEYNGAVNLIDFVELRF